MTTCACALRRLGRTVCTGNAIVWTKFVLPRHLAAPAWLFGSEYTIVLGYVALRPLFAADAANKTADPEQLDVASRYLTTMYWTITTVTTVGCETMVVALEERACFASKSLSWDYSLFFEMKQTLDLISP